MSARGWAPFAAFAAIAAVFAVAALLQQDGGGAATPRLTTPADTTGRSEAPPGAVGRHRKPKPYTSPSGLFIQERASKGLPGPGQHFSFGALRPWDDILALLEDREDRKLLLVVRHGQAVSNYLGDTLGPDEWFAVEGTCEYTDKDGKYWDIFDADLTELGEAQAQSLNSMLDGGGWFQKVTGGRPVRAIISPLSRCLHTAASVLKGLPINATNVEELVRETLGEDTCDARRSVSDPEEGGKGGDDNPDVDDPDDDGGDDDDDKDDEDEDDARVGKKDKRPPAPPCSFEKGLRSKFPGFKFHVYGPEDEEDRSFGLLGDRDWLWTKRDREKQAHQVKRATRFLDILFDNAPEKVVTIVTHSGFARSILLAVQREPYRPNNAELVPIIVDKWRHADRGEVSYSYTVAGEEEPEPARSTKAARRPLRGAAAAAAAEGRVEAS